MGLNLDTTIPRDVGGGQTGVERLAGFVNIRTTGIADMARKMVRLAQLMGASDDGHRFLSQAAAEASRPLLKRYKSSVGHVTGNLARSAATKRGKNKIDGVGIAVTGPSHRKAEKDEWILEKAPPSEKNVAGNHGWLVEFGTGRRKPGTQARRTLINLHDNSSGKLRKRDGTFNDEDLRKSRGSTRFVMSNYKTQAGPRFFMALGPNGSYGAMPAKHALERSIAATHSEVSKFLAAAVQKRIAKLSTAP